MDAQARGLAVARRNALDGISFVQTAEGALNEVVNGLQRIRELGIQSINGTNNESDRKALQAEVEQLRSEFDRINSATKFNGDEIFNQSSYAAAADNTALRDILTGLKSSWLREAESRISEYFGLEGDGRNVEIDVAGIDGVGGSLAQANADLIRIDFDDYLQVTLPQGDSTTASFAADRVIGHEVVHTMQFINLNMAALPDWFTEGSAEFIGGADDRVLGDKGGGTVDALVTATGLVDNFAGTSAEYSVGYLGVRYMHEKIKEAGGEGIKQIFEYLRDNSGSTLDQAVTNASSGAFADLATFKTSFTSNAAGEGDDFVNGLDLTNEDLGAIGGFDADGGEVFSEDSIYPNQSSLGQEPLLSLNAQFNQSIDPTAKSGGKVTTLSIGAHGESVDFHLGSFNTAALGLSNIDLTKDGAMAVSYVDDALEYVSMFRSQLGALQNRLESTINNLAVQEQNTEVSKSRIVDADFSTEVSSLTKAQIIQQASTSMLAQANTEPRIAFALLR
jgi:flagellin